MMTYPKSLILFFCIQAFLALFSMPISHGRTFFPSDEATINLVCAQTYNAKLCIQTLESDPRGANADVKGMAVITVDAMKTHGNDALNKIQALLKGNPSPGQKDSLNYCVSMYTEILNQNIPAVAQALNSGDYTTAQSKAIEASDNVDMCEQSFFSSKPPAGSPITDKNDVMYAVSQNAAFIIRRI